MSIITDFTRMWLTRSTKPFIFKNEYDQHLQFMECENLGLYVHIPFCENICSFCPYCKEVYTKEKCDTYIDALLKEIHMVGSQMWRNQSINADKLDEHILNKKDADKQETDKSETNKSETNKKETDKQETDKKYTDIKNRKKKQVTSLYFGGGTPALAADRLKEIIEALQEYFIITEGIGLELHPDNVTIELLAKIKEAGVTKISIGIQSFLQKYQKILGRKSVNVNAMTEALKQVLFETVSMDFIFALPGQTYEDLKDDIALAFSYGANHVAVYPFIDFTFTSSNVQVMKKREKRKLLDQITEYCMEKGYHRSSIWTFSSEKEAKYSSMTRDNFLGFGCSATTLLREQFKINTFSVEEYCRRIKEQKLPTSLTIRFSERQRMVYYLFWTAYSTKVDSREFERFFGKRLQKMYGFELWLAKKMGFVEETDGVYRMTLKGAFYYHYYENFYTLAYIDKMWGIMRKEAFPEHIKL